MPTAQNTAQYITKWFLNMAELMHYVTQASSARACDCHRDYSVLYLHRKCGRSGTKLG